MTASVGGRRHTLTANQRGIWLHEASGRGPGAFDLAHALWVREDGDGDDLAALWREELIAHDALRSRFVEVDGEPWRVVDDEPQVDVRYTIAEGWSDEDLAAACRTETEQGFDLATGPLARLVMYSVRPDLKLVLVLAHHIVMDMWSFALVADGLTRRWGVKTGRDVAPPKPPRVGFDHAVAAEQAYLDGDAAAAALEFWEPRFRATGDPLSLPFDRTPHPDDPARGAAVVRSLDGVTTERLRAVAVEAGASLPSVVLAGYAELLARYDRRGAIPISMLRANRDAQVARTAGFFVNTVLLLAELDGEPSFRELVARIDEEERAVGRHGRYPYTLLSGAFGDPTHDPSRDRIAQVGFGWQITTRLVDRSLTSASALDAGGTTATINSVAGETYRLGERPVPNDLQLLAAEVDGTIALSLEYRAARFDEATAEAVLDHLVSLLDHASLDPDRPVSELDVRADADVVDDGPHRHTLVGLVEDAVDRWPDRPAVADGDRSLTYREADEWANRLAHHLAAAGVGAGSRVGVSVRRDAFLPSVLLAVNKAGAAYVPLDPTYPDDRLAFMVENADVSLVIVDGSVDSAVFGDVATVDIDAERVAIDARPADRPGRAVDADDVVYVIYTSGSTGRPKGVELPHGCLAHQLEAFADRPGIRPDDTVLAATTVSFDPSTNELFMPLLRGARIHVVDESVRLDPRAFRRAIEESGATVVQATPTVWRLIVEAGWANPGTVRVLCGGEPLTPELLEALAGNGAEVWNIYGPTEATVWSAAEEVHVGERITVGRPNAGVTYRVVDERRRTAPVGATAELWIAGPVLANGYVGRPDLTDEVFVEHDGIRWYRSGDLAVERPDGRFDIRGRADTQVKIRGNRIELGEIESVIAGDPSVEGVAVIVQEFGADDLRLVAFVTGDVDIERVRARCRAALSPVMVPSGFVAIDDFPLTPSRKIDRRALAARHRGEAPVSAGRPPATDAERRLASIWSDVLGGDEVPADVSFFELGGHSLLATQVVTRVLEEFGALLPIAAIFEATTIEALCARIEQAEAGAGTERFPIIDVPRGGPLPLSSSQERMWFLHTLNPTGAAYNIATGLRIDVDLDPEAADRALARLVERHESLRTRFVVVDGETRQIIEPTTDTLRLEVVDHRAESDPDAAALRRLDDDARRPVDLGALPLARFSLHRVDGASYLGVTLHHIVGDLWSMGVLVREAVALYLEETGGPEAALAPVDVQYVDYALSQRAWLDAGEMDDQLAYWRDRLRDVTGTEYPTDHARPPVVTGAGAVFAEELPEPVADAIRRLCRTYDTTEFIVVLTALMAVLHRASSTDDVTVGVPVANRNSRASEGLISSLVNTLVLRGDLSGEPSLRTLLARVQAASLEAYEHQDLPFERLVAELEPARDPSRSPFFQVFLNVLNAPLHLETFGPVSIDWVPIDRRAAQFDLSVNVSAGLGRVGVEYATDLYDESTISALLEQMWVVVDQLDRSPERRLADLDLTERVARHRPLPVETAGTLQSDHVAFEAPVGPLETTIAEIWQEVLGVGRVSRHDDFFRLGGHSLLAVRFFNELELRRDESFPLIALFEGSTVAGLAEVLERGDVALPEGSVIPLRTEGAGVPFFDVSPYLVTALSFAELASAVGRDRPFYALDPQALGDEGDDAGSESIEGMARRFIADMKTIQPDGPYLLGGHCAGNLVALEMAGQLQEAGDEVGALILVDGGPPGIRPPRITPLRWLRSRIRLYALSTRLWPSLRWQFGIALARWRQRRAREDGGRQELVLAGELDIAHRSYDGRVVAGDALLVRSSELHGLDDKDWHLRWDELITGELDVEVVESSHALMLRSPQVGDLAERMRAYLAARSTP
ncbi:MAG: amino acid adenylation domain-containing protein [Actinomycetota bacterium]